MPRRCNTKPRLLIGNNNILGWKKLQSKPRPVRQQYEVVQRRTTPKGTDESRSQTFTTVPIPISNEVMNNENHTVPTRLDVKWDVNADSENCLSGG